MCREYTSGLAGSVLYISVQESGDYPRSKHSRIRDLPKPPCMSGRMAALKEKACGPRPQRPNGRLHRELWICEDWFSDTCCGRFFLEGVAKRLLLRKISLTRSQDWTMEPQLRTGNHANSSLFLQPHPKVRTFVLITAPWVQSFRV